MTAESDHGKSAVIARMQRAGAVAVIRTETADEALNTARAVIAGGFCAVEITYTIPDATEVIAQLAASSEQDALIGAGTVLTVSQTTEAIDAGAAFVVSPSIIPSVIEVARTRGVAVLPGALTPTEIYTAHSLGGDIIKIFPAVRFGPQYLRDLRGPLPHIPLMPTAGVNTGNVAEWFAAGAVAVGAGSSVIDPAAIRTSDWATVTARAREFVAAVTKARQASELSS